MDHGLKEVQIFARPEQMCDCGHPRKEHWFRCRAAIGIHTILGPEVFVTRCQCTKFTNPGMSIRALHPSEECPCSECFLQS